MLEQGISFHSFTPETSMHLLLVVLTKAGGREMFLCTLFTRAPLFLLQTFTPYLDHTTLLTVSLGFDRFHHRASVKNDYRAAQEPGQRRWCSSNNSTRRRVQRSRCACRSRGQLSTAAMTEEGEQNQQTEENSCVIPLLFLPGEAQRWQQRSPW